MSRAFVNEDAGGGDAPGKYTLPDPGDPGFALAAGEVVDVFPYPRNELLRRRD